MTYLRTALMLFSCIFCLMAAPVAAQIAAAAKTERGKAPSALDMMLDPSMSHCIRTAKGCDSDDYQDAYDSDCKQENAASCFNLGQLLARRIDLSELSIATSYYTEEYKVADRAYISYAKACELGYAKACVNQGFLLLYGVGVDDDRDKARRLFTAACENGEADGCYNTGYLWKGGSYGDSIPEKRRSFYTKACDLGHVKGCHNLGVITNENAYYYENQAERELLLTASRTQFAKACDGKLSLACNNLGEMMVNGRGGVVDITKATRLFADACNEDRITEACYNLGVILFKPYADSTKVPKDPVNSNPPHYSANTCFSREKGYCMTRACDDQYNKFCKDLIYVGARKEN